MSRLRSLSRGLGGETLVPPAQALVAAAATHAGCSDKESAGNSSDFDDKASIDAGHKAAKEEEKDGAADWSDDEYPGDDDGFDYDFCAYRSNHPEFDFLRFDRLREREQVRCWSTGLFTLNGCAICMV